MYTTKVLENQEFVNVGVDLAKNVFQVAYTYRMCLRSDRALCHEIGGVFSTGKRKLVWIADRDKALAYAVRSDEMLLTVHRWFARKSCPGNWLFERMGSLAQEVNSRLG